MLLVQLAGALRSASTPTVPSEKRAPRAPCTTFAVPKGQRPHRIYLLYLPDVCHPRHTALSHPYPRNIRQNMPPDRESSPPSTSRQPHDPPQLNKGSIAKGLRVGRDFLWTPQNNLRNNWRIFRLALSLPYMYSYNSCGQHSRGNGVLLSSTLPEAPAREQPRCRRPLCRLGYKRQAKPAAWHIGPISFQLSLLLGNARPQKKKNDPALFPARNRASPSPCT